MSDHFSGPRALAGPQCDICDFYAFPSPERPDTLVLVTDVVPRAMPTSTFSDGILYRFRLRPADIAGTGAVSAFSIGDEDRELIIDCSFLPARIDGNGRVEQVGICRTPFTAPITFGFNDTVGDARDSVRVF